MRFKATQNNLVVQVAADELAALIHSAILLLVPRHAQKVYFLAEPESLFAPSQEGVVVVKAGSEPSNFLQSFRLLLRPGELVVVSSQQRRFTQSEWRSFAEAMAAHAT
jgi:hypothetical protein